MGQIAQESNQKLQGGLPSDTVSSSKGKEQCNAVATLSGRQLQPISLPQLDQDDEDEDIEEVYSDPEPVEKLK